MPALQVRLGEDEYSRCREMAKSAGVSMSEWVRGRLFDRTVEPPTVGIPRPLEGAVYSVAGPAVIAAPAREVPLPPARGRRVPKNVLSVAEKMASEPPRGTSTTAMFIDEVPDDAALNALPPEYGLIEDGEPPLPVGLPDEMPEAHGEILEESALENSRPHVITDQSGLQLEVHVSHEAPKRKPFTRSPKCTSDKCARLQAPTCEACRKANAGGIVTDDTPQEERPAKAWASGQRSPTCITAKCGQLGAACCEPCRKFNARGFQEVEF